MVKCAALVVAAGRGSRFGGELPKQWCDLAGRPILRHSLAAFAAHPGVDRVLTVIHPDDRVFFDAAAAGLAVETPVAGGPSRQDSVRNGLSALAADPPDLVLIHDGARPFVGVGVISRVIRALADDVAVIPALPVHDTLKRATTDGHVGDTVPRTGLWRAQTPQGFRFSSILDAHRAAAGLELTDDAAVAEHAGLPVRLVDGAEDNVKITTAEDLGRAALRLAGPGSLRVGNGYDVHEFTGGDHVVLCNVRVPHDAALKGHSDADAALHAITDALLGTIGAGDIGRHFPPTDPRWKGADSAIFLAHAVHLVRALGGTISHADVTIVCERPKIGPHRLAMTARLAAILGIDEGRVNVKATTTEGLGFTGRREGIAAQATVSVMMPG